MTDMQSDPGRSRRPIVIGIAIAATVLAVGALVWFQPHKLFIDDEVNEPLPGLVVGDAGAQPPPTTEESMTDDSMMDDESMTDDSAMDDESMTDDSMMDDESMTDDSMMDDEPASALESARQLATESGQPQVVTSGAFVSLDHATSGTALVVALPEGGLVVRFEDLDTSNGPDLRVVLSPHAPDSGTYDGLLELGRLKGNIGDQNYDVPPDVDLSRFASVVIWCERFSAPFGAAPLAVM